MATGATYAGVLIMNASDVSWELKTGTRPTTTTIVVAAKYAERMRGQMGKAGTLEVTAEGGLGYRVDDVYVIDETPSPHPDMVAFTLADRRFKWVREHVTRRYNIRRRTGDRRLITEGQPAGLPADVPDIAYESATLLNGQPWTARDIVLDVLSSVDVDGPGFSMSGLPMRQITIEGLELDDDGAAAIDRALDHIAGADVYLDLKGTVRFVDTTDASAANSLLKRLGPPVVGVGLASMVDYAGLRPAWIDVLFSVEQELKFTSLDEGGAYSQRGNVTKYMENVLPVPDLTLAVAGRTVTRGTFITFDEAFAAWGAPTIAAGAKIPGGGASAALTHDLVRLLWHGGRLEAVYAAVGDVIADANWAARIRAVRQHYRQTYRISPYWMARIRSISAERVAVIDPENGVRAPAFVTANYAFAPSVRGRWTEPGRQGIVVNVDAYADSLAAAKQAPATVTIVDEQLGVIHLSYQADALGLHQAVYPCKLETPLPSMNFGKGAGPMTIDGCVYEGAAPVKLAASHKVAIVVTAVPSAPNSNDQHYRVRVTPSDAQSNGVKVGAATGPGWTIRIGPGVTTARFAWADALDATIDKMFGAARTTKPGERATYAAGDTLAASGLLVDRKEVENVAKAAGTSLYGQMIDRVVGAHAVKMDDNLVPVGNASAVEHTLAPDGSLNSIVRFDRATGRVDIMAYMDNATRRRLFGMVQP